MSDYYYMDIALDPFEQSDKKRAAFVPEDLKDHIISSLRTLFGEAGGSATVDLLKIRSDSIVVRVPAAFCVKLRASLTVAPTFHGTVWHIGKDRVIFATVEDHRVPSTVTLPPAKPAPGLILEDGSINWNCPCLGGMATGPCGVEFRQAFSCFHYSAAEPKGSDCYEAFSTMQTCMAKFPTLYNKDTDGADLEDNRMPAPPMQEKPAVVDVPATNGQQLANS